MPIAAVLATQRAAAVEKMFTHVDCTRVTHDRQVAHKGSRFCYGAQIGVP